MSSSGVRLHSLDYLRGLCAFGIMIFHCICHIYMEPPTDSFLAKVGVYGVSVFYILSGITLFHVYKNKFNSGIDVFIFYLKRFFRIFPLLWLCIILTVLLTENFNSKILFINFTGLFGFIYRTDYMVEGAWSIGNELYFYLLFPILIFLYQKNKFLNMCFYILTVLLGIYYAYVLLNTDVSLKDQWSIYIHPLNQYFLFVGGAAIVAFFKDSKISNGLVISLLLMAILVFVFYPVSEGDILLVTGTRRMVYAICCFLVCFSTFKLQFDYPVILHKILGFMGKISYSMYLIHPIMILLVVKLGLLQDFKLFQVLTVLALTFVISGLVYYFIEEKFINLGGVISERIKTRRNGTHIK